MISGKTSLVGLLGDPVDHSISPVIQNAALQEMGLDWCYVAMPCAPEHLESVTKALHKLNFQGLNITIPHKQKAINICNHISPLARQVGAINTLLPNKEGGWSGFNTDVEGFLVPLQTKKWSQKKAMILGCGGSAKAVIAGLKTLDFSEIAIVGRKEDILKSFILDIKANKVDFQEKTVLYKGLLHTSDSLISQIKESHLIVNTTPVGMSAKNKSYSQNQELPLGEKIWEHLQPETTLYDLIYTPRPTPWLTLGGEVGCQQIDGLEMLVQQGAASLRIWNQCNQIPIDTMRIAAKNYLSL